MNILKQIVAILSDRGSRRMSQLAALFAVGVVAIPIAAHAAWTEPTGSPPFGNVAAPLNVSSVRQTKDGQLVIKGPSGNGYGLQGIGPDGAELAEPYTGITAGILGTGGLTDADTLYAAGVYGVGYAADGTGLQIGLMGVAGTNAVNSIGVYGWDGTTDGTGAGYAGYFRGKVSIEGGALCFGTDDCINSWNDIAGSGQLFEESPTNNTYLKNTSSNLAIGGTGTNDDAAAFFFTVTPSSSRGTFYADNAIVIGPPPVAAEDGVCSVGEDCSDPDCFGQPDSCSQEGYLCDPGGSGACIDGTPPAVPTFLHSIDVQTDSLTLAWNANTESDLGGYRLYRCNSDACITSTNVSGDLNRSATSFQNTGLTANTTYKYFVTAFDTAGNESQPSTKRSVATLSPPDVAPETPTGFVQVDATSLSITLGWNANTEPDLDVYRVYSCNNLACSTQSTLADVPANTSPLQKVVTNLAPSTTYFYRIAARDQTDHESAPSAVISATTSNDTDPPATPENLHADGIIGPFSFTLAWNANTEADLAGYKLYSVVDGTRSLLVNIAKEGTNPPATSHPVEGLNPQTTYTYTMLAYDSYGNESGFHADVPVTTAKDPDAPSTLTLSAVAGDTFVDLTWTASSDGGNGTGISGYNIFRCNTAGCTPGSTPLITVGNVTAYQDTGLQANKTFNYQVSALDNALPLPHNESVRSNKVQVTTESGGGIIQGTPGPVLDNSRAPTPGAGDRTRAGNLGAIRPLSHVVGSIRRSFFPALIPAVQAAVGGGQQANADPNKVRLTVNQGVLQIVGESNVLELGRDGTGIAGTGDVTIKPANRGGQTKVARFSNTAGEVDMTIGGTSTAGKFCLPGEDNCVTDWADITGDLQGLNGSITAGQIAFGTDVDTIGGDDNLVWKGATRKFGIGMNEPGEKLDVAGGNIRTDGQFISAVATGTAPLAVSSTTEVTNLNADLLDGEQGNFYRDANNINTGILKVGFGGTGTNAQFTSGSIVFAGANGIYQQDNANLFWDNTNNRLGIGTTPGSYTLNVAGNANATGVCITDDCIDGWNNFIRNSSVSQGPADFNIDGSGRIGTALTVDQTINLPTLSSALPNSIDRGGTLNGDAYTSRYIFGADGSGSNEYFGIASSNNAANPIFSLSDGREVHLGSTGVGNASSLCFYGSGSEECVNKKSDIGGVFSGSIAAGQVAYGTDTNKIGGSSDLVWDATTNKLGIGTNPGVTLDVLGADGSGTIAKFARGGSEKPLYISSVWNTDSYISSEGNIRLRTNVPANDPLGAGAVEAVKIDTSGNVGIGTTTPGYRTDVAGSLAVSDGLFLNSRPNLIATQAHYGTDDYGGGASGWSAEGSGATVTSVTTPSDGFHRAFLRMQSDGTHDTDRLWALNGAMTTEFVADNQYRISFRYRATGGSFDIGNRDHHIATVPANTGTAQFYATTYTPQATECDSTCYFMVFLNSANNTVEIGDLFIENLTTGTLKNRFAADALGGLYVSGGADPPYTQRIAEFNYDNGTHGSIAIEQILGTGVPGITTVGSNNLFFSTNEATSQMVLDTSGNVGIGAAEPDTNYKLEVTNGGVKATSNSAQTDQPAGYFNAPNGAYGLIVDNGNVGIGDTSPASLLTVGDGDTFQVDAGGNLVKVNNVAYSWPAAIGSNNQVLTVTDRDTGTLGWADNTAGATADAPFIVAASDATLTAARVLQGTANQLNVADNAGAGTFTLSTPQDIHTAASPAFAGLNLSGLTASQGVFTDGSKNLTSTGILGAGQGGTGADSSGWTGVLTVAGGVWNNLTQLSVPLGGTNNASYTADKFLVYNGTAGKIESSAYDNTSFLTQESDTLATVTGRGATTNTAVAIGGSVDANYGVTVGTLGLKATSNSTQASQPAGYFDAPNGAYGLIVDRGNVGIGTATPDTALHIQRTTDTDLLKLSNSYANLLFSVDASSNAVINQFNNAPLLLKTNNATAMTILGNGNVGIGEASPQAKLDVAGTTYLNSRNQFSSTEGQFNNLRFTTNSSSLYGRFGGVNDGGPNLNAALMSFNTYPSYDTVWHWNRDDSSRASAAWRLGYQDVDVLPDVAAQLLVSPSGTGDIVWNKALNVLTNGNVGIGTTGPSNTLQVIGSASFGATTPSNTTGAVNIQNGRANLTSAATLIYVGTPLATNYSGFNFQGQSVSDMFFGRAASSDDLVISTANTASPAELVRFKQSGNVGIGQILPSAKLVVNNNLSGTGSTGDAIAAYANSANAALYAEQQGAGYAGYLSGDIVVGNAAFTSNLVTNGDFATGTGGWTATNWSYDAVNQEMDHTVGNTSSLSQTFTTANGEIYVITFEVRNQTAGSITPRIGGVSGTAVTSNGVFTQTITATANGNGPLSFIPTTDFNGSLDNISMKRKAARPGMLQLAELSANGSQYIGFKAPDAVNASQIYTLPDATPSSTAFLKSNASGNFSWDTNTYGTGTVTSVGPGTPNTQSGTSGLTFSPNPITGAGTIALSTTNVSAGSYGSATQVGTFTVDAQGRITSASNVAISATDALTVKTSGTDSTAGFLSAELVGGDGLTFTETGSGNTQGTFAVGTGDGITVSSDTIAVKLNETNPGLQADTNGLSLIRSCAPGKVLKAGGGGGWGCADDVTTGSATLTTDHLFVGNASNSPTDVAATGDASLAFSGPSSGVFTITGLQGRAVANTAPTPNQVLQWNGSQWGPGTISTGGITNLNTLTASIQTFAIGTSGTAPNWSSAVSTHTLNIPLASTASVTAGLISKTDYDSFTNKLSNTLNSANIFVGNASNVATGVALSGDATISNAGALAIAANAVALTTDTTGNYVAGIGAGSDIDVTGTAGEGWSPSVALQSQLDTVTTISRAASNLTLQTTGASGNILLNPVGRVLINNPSDDANYKIVTVGGGLKAESNTASQPAVFINNTNIQGYGLLVQGRSAATALTQTRGLTNVAAGTAVSGTGSANGNGPTYQGRNDYWNASATQTLIVDLGSLVDDVKAVSFGTNYREDQSQMPKDYQIDYSTDNINYSSFMSAVTGNNQPSVIHYNSGANGVDARYIRITVNATQGAAPAKIAGVQVLTQAYSAQYGAEPFSIVAGGDNVTLATGGNVGLGTTSPAFKLDVQGIGQFTGALKIGAYTLPNTDGISGQVLQTNGTGTVSWGTVSGGGSQWTTTGSDIYYNTGGVAIGLAAPPTGKLEVRGTTEQLRLSYNASSYATTTVASTGATTFNAVGSSQSFAFSDNVSVTGNLTLTGDAAVGGNDIFTATSIAAQTLAISNPGSGSASLSIEGLGTGAIYANSNVLTSEAQLALIRGGTGADLLAAAQGGIVYKSSGTALGISAAGTAGDCLISGGSGAPAWGECGTGGGGLTGSGNVNYLTKWTVGGSVIGDSLVFDNGTNLGIGTTSPDPNYKLEVTSGGIKTTSATAGNPAGYFNNTGTGTKYALITDQGNVGIGNTTPTGKLVVNNNQTGNGYAGNAIAAYANSNADSGIRVEQKGTGNAAYFLSSGTNLSSGGNNKALNAENASNFSLSADTTSYGAYVLNLARRTAGAGNLSNIGLYVSAQNGQSNYGLIVDQGNSGFGTTIPKSKLDISGNLTVGTYAGVTAAPTNGAIISGPVGIGASSVGNQLEVINASAGSAIRASNSINNNNAVGAYKSGAVTTGSAVYGELVSGMTCRNDPGDICAGVYGSASNVVGTPFDSPPSVVTGLYGAAGGANSFAGWFQGDVHIEGGNLDVGGGGIKTHIEYISSSGNVNVDLNDSIFIVQDSFPNPGYSVQFALPVSQSATDGKSFMIYRANNDGVAYTLLPAGFNTINGVNAIYTTPNTAWSCTRVTGYLSSQWIATQGC